MASAPTPGVGRRMAISEETDKALDVKIRITCAAENRTLELSLGDLGPRDDLISRQHTGFPVTSFFAADQIGPLSVLVLWWTMRRHHGDPNLAWKKVEGAYRDNRRFAAAGFEVWVEDPNDPEADEIDDDPGGAELSPEA